jgi:hypothetical protein
MSVRTVDNIIGNLHSPDSGIFEAAGRAKM